MPIGHDRMTDEQAERIHALLMHIDLADAMERKTDAELADLLLEIWGELSIDSPAAAVIGEAISRLHKEEVE